MSAGDLVFHDPAPVPAPRAAPAPVLPTGPPVAGIATAGACGAFAGLIGGLVFGAAQARLDLLPALARLVGGDSAELGLAVELVIATLLGTGFAVLIRQRRAAAGETVFWGLAYGMSCWYLGPLTVLPLLSGEPTGWSVPAAQAAFPLLLGWLLYGAITALTLAGLDRIAAAATDSPGPTGSPGPTDSTGSPGSPGSTARRTGRRTIRGLVAGLTATWVLTGAIPGSAAVLAAGNAPWALYGLGAVAGVGYCLLFPATAQATGPAAVQGAGYGFLLWVTVPLTALPLLEDNQLLWSAREGHDLFATLPAFVLLGALIAGLGSGLARLSRLLLAAPAERAEEEGVGARTLRAAGHGGTAGVIGGLLFTVIMVQIGYLSTVAGLVGSDVTAVGLAVHLTVSVILGSSYGLLFRRQSYDPVSGIGWGISYGFLWWVLGALTVLPLALGGSAQWSAQNAASAFPSLIGHLVYGAGLGAVFHRLEARHDPWWTHRSTVARRAATAAARRRASAIRRRTELRASAPAVWALVVPMALTVTVVLGG